MCLCRGSKFLDPPRGLGRDPSIQTTPILFCGLRKVGAAWGDRKKLSVECLDSGVLRHCFKTTPMSVSDLAGGLTLR